MRIHGGTKAMFTEFVLSLCQELKSEVLHYVFHNELFISFK